MQNPQILWIKQERVHRPSTRTASMQQMQKAQRIIKDAHKTVELERDKTVADLQSY